MIKRTWIPRISRMLLEMMFSHRFHGLSQIFFDYGFVWFYWGCSVEIYRRLWRLAVAPQPTIAEQPVSAVTRGDTYLSETHSCAASQLAVGFMIWVPLRGTRSSYSICFLSWLRGYHSITLNQLLLHLLASVGAWLRRDAIASYDYPFSAVQVSTCLLT